MATHPPSSLAQRLAFSAPANLAACLPSPPGRWGIELPLFRRMMTHPPARWRTWKSPPHYDDLDAVRSFAKNVSVVTFEFENVPAATAAAAAEFAPVATRRRCAAHHPTSAARKNFFTATWFSGRTVSCGSIAGGTSAGAPSRGLPAVLKSPVGDTMAKDKWRFKPPIMLTPPGRA